MIRRASLFSFAVVLTLFCASAPAQLASLPGSVAAHRYSLSDWEIETPRVARGANTGEVVIELDIKGETRFITLAPVENRADDFKLLVGTVEGDMVEAKAPASSTYRGTTDLGSLVAASRTADGWSLFVAGDQEYWIAEPLKETEPDAPSETLLVYQGADAGDQAFTCGGAIITEESLRSAARGAAGTLAPNERYVVDFAIDCDFQYVADQGDDSVEQTLERAERVLNGVIMIYERDSQITFRLKGVAVRSPAQSDPYLRPFVVGEEQLQRMTQIWSSGAVDIEHDLAHVFHGFSFAGNIGFANADSVCTPTRYGWDSVGTAHSLGRNIRIVAHEIGHNFSAPHCDGEEGCGLMFSVTGFCETSCDPRIGPITLDRIHSFAATRDCLTIETIGGAPADLNGDGCVDSSDLAILLAAWGTTGDGDVDGSGATGSGDLAVLLAAWGGC